MENGNKGETEQDGTAERSNGDRAVAPPRLGFGLFLSAFYFAKLMAPCR